MAVIATDTLGLSNLLKRAHPWMESDGWGIEVVETDEDMGQVMIKESGIWAAIDEVPSTFDQIGVVLDATKEDADFKRVLFKGDAVVAKEALVYFTGATSGNKLSVDALLEAADIQVNTQV